MEYKNPALTVDGIIETNKGIVLIKRKNPPFKDEWALPGGFVDYGEEVENAFYREMLEELSINTKISHLLGVYSKPDRDPRGHTVSIVYIASINGDEKGLKAADDAAQFRIIKDPLSLELAFDHRKILEDYFLFKTNN